MPTHHNEPLLERYQRERREFEGMNMSEHTSGKLIQAGLESQDSHWMREIRQDGGMSIAFCGSFPATEAHANARRLVACWNWCDGLSTENLEDNIPAIELAKRYNEVIRERDRLSAINAELLDALKTARDHIDMEALRISHCNDAEQIGAAIAKAQGEQL